MTVILPGSYDPVTLGHVEIIERASREYEKVYAVVFNNDEKTYMFSMKERLEMLELALSHLENVITDASLGRVVDYMREKKIDKIVKGYRDEGDLEYEKIQSAYNYENGGFETEFYKSDENLKRVSSTLAREAIVKKGNLSVLLPQKVIDFLSSVIDK